MTDSLIATRIAARLALAEAVALRLKLAALRLRKVAADARLDDRG